MESSTFTSSNPPSSPSAAMPAVRLTLAGHALGAALILTAFAGAGCASSAEPPGTAPQPAASQHDTVQQNTAPSAAAGQSSTEQDAARLTALDKYVVRPEPLYQWEKMPPAEAPGTAASAAAAANDTPAEAATGAGVTDLRVTSQEWQGHVWRHHVQVFRPAHLEHPDTALVLVTYGGSPGETLLGQLIANATGAVFVQLFDIPNQPLFDKREDDLIAYTFEKYLETGDETWPLLFPMTKSVVKTMDAVTELAQQQWKQPITRFVISGASKRGWTTWLTGAVDKRVIGIIPVVYNNLNLPRQMPHQLETWGRYSEQIEDYTRRGLQAQLATPRGQHLAEMVDPWSYRDRLVMPKLIVNATNDRYWTLDALNLYHDGLKGETSVLYVPNAGHSMEGQEQRVFGSSTAWFRRLAAGQPVPHVTIEAGPVAAGGSRLFTLTPQPFAEIKTARLWLARSATRDFRDAQWQALPMTRPEPGAWGATAPAAGDAALKYAAAFAEIEIEGAPLPLRLSSALTLWSTSPPGEVGGR